MKTVLISPYSKVLRNGERNPKSYEHWERLLAMLHDDGWHITQLIFGGEPKLQGADAVMKNVPFGEQERLLKHFKTWISVDNYFHHLAVTTNKPGVVIFTRSDPVIYGHKENVNLLRDRKYLRYDQYGIWEQCNYIADASIEPEKVFDAVNNIM